MFRNRLQDAYILYLYHSHTNTLTCSKTIWVKILTYQYVFGLRAKEEKVHRENIQTSCKHKVCKLVTELRT